MVVNTEETRVMVCITLAFENRRDRTRFLKHNGLPLNTRDGVLLVKLTDDNSQTKLDMENDED
jgi:hypothetical protein